MEARSVFTTANEDTTAARAVLSTLDRGILAPGAAARLQISKDDGINSHYPYAKMGT